MKKISTLNWVLVTALTLSSMQSVRAELTTENQAADREETRQVIESSESAQTTQTATVNTVPVVEHISKSELMRRERLRAEMKNEDVLQQRLEELRLRDEKRRTSDILDTENEDGTAAKEDAGNQNVNPAVVNVKTEVINGNGKVEDPKANQTGQNSASIDLSASESDATKINLQIQAKPGFSNFLGSTGYETSGQFALGFGLGLELTDVFALEAGYSYSEYGAQVPISNYTVANYLNWSKANNFPVDDNSVTKKQNMFELGGKAYILGRDSRVRPFFSGGGAYSLSYVNYNSKILEFLKQYGLSDIFGKDVSANGFVGYLGAGVDFVITKNISIGAQTRYYKVFSTKTTSTSIATAQPSAAYAAPSYSGYGSTSGYYPSYSGYSSTSGYPTSYYGTSGYSTTPYSYGSTSYPYSSYPSTGYSTTYPSYTPSYTTGSGYASTAYSPYSYSTASGISTSNSDADKQTAAAGLAGASFYVINLALNVTF